MPDKGCFCFWQYFLKCFPHVSNRVTRQVSGDEHGQRQRVTVKQTNSWAASLQKKKTDWEKPLKGLPKKNVGAWCAVSWFPSDAIYRRVQKLQSRKFLAPLYERCSSDVDGLWSPIHPSNPIQSNHTYSFECSQLSVESLKNQIQKWPKIKNEPNSKVTQIQKWPKFKNDPNSKKTQIQKWPK